jgi:hypothetical protein
VESTLLNRLATTHHHTLDAAQETHAVDGEYSRSVYRMIRTVPIGNISIDQSHRVK